MKSGTSMVGGRPAPVSLARPHVVVISREPWPSTSGSGRRGDDHYCVRMDVRVECQDDGCSSLLVCSRRCALHCLWERLTLANVSGGCGCTTSSFLVLASDSLMLGCARAARPRRPRPRGWMGLQGPTVRHDDRVPRPITMLRLQAGCAARGGRRKPSPADAAMLSEVRLVLRRWITASDDGERSRLARLGLGMPERHHAGAWLHGRLDHRVPCTIACAGSSGRPTTGAGSGCRRAPPRRRPITHSSSAPSGRPVRNWAAMNGRRAGTAARPQAEQALP